ncbi:unnamed protein product [Phytophthora fragariaefolia]|uniref:Unnamed protein product n=1 Tax=Phytophthora fragariaefolia TaxID=1490495 RepID=A0A9W7D0Z7_9STRA|nr:unnamed protein product [Phytophthora fragariaefolia]
MYQQTPLQGVYYCDADVDVKDFSGATALMAAAGGGHLDVVRYLVKDCGADVDVKKSNGGTALVRAAERGHLDVVQFLVKDGDADVNVKDKDGGTALLRAAAGGNPAVVRFLVSDCDTVANGIDRNGCTALMMAAAAGNRDVVRFIVKACDADVNMKGQFLIKHSGADVNMKNNDGDTMLTSAARKGYLDVVRILISGCGADVNVVDSHGSTALMETEGGDLLHVVLFLVQDGNADVNAKYNNGRTAIRMAVDHGHDDIVRYASLGSLVGYAERYSLHQKPPLVWKYLHEATLGLEYLHERGVVHGDLRCRNILISSDGLAKLSNFRLARATTKSSLVGDVIGSMRWQAPEILEGKAPSRESDIYSLGMCILESESGKIPLSRDDSTSAREMKMKWNMNAQEKVFYDILASIACKLQCLSLEESMDSSQPELEPACTFHEYLSGEMMDLWYELQTCVNASDMVQYHPVFGKLKRVHDCLQRSEQSERLLGQFYSLLIDAYQAVNMSPEEICLLRLTSTRVTTTSLYSSVGAWMHC